MNQSRRNPGRPWVECGPNGDLWFLAAVALAAVSLGLGDDAAREWTRYERAGIASGQAWRLVLGHFVHLGWSHVVLNLTALGLLRWLLGPVLRGRDWLVIFAVSAGVIDAGLFWLSPAVEWYVGLSGILHAVAVLAGLRLLRDEGWVGGALLAGLVLKLLWEQRFGASGWSIAVSGGPVVVDAHLYGAVGGVLAAALWPRFRALGAAIIPPAKSRGNT